MMQQRATAATFGPPPSETALEPDSGLGTTSTQHAPGWMLAVDRGHARVMAAVTLFIAAASAGDLLPRAVELAVLVGSVSLLGLPHGALDYLSGRELFRPKFGRLWFVPFGGVYLGMVAIVIASWWANPAWSLVGFFVVAAAHFGFDDVRPELALAADTRFATIGRTVEIVTRGSLVIVALLYMHSSEVSALFAHLIPAPREALETTVLTVAPRLAVLNGALLTVVLAHHLGGWAAGSDAHGRVALEILALTALFCMAPPLIAFVVYFCLWHAFRHSLQLAASLDSSGPGPALKAFARAAWPTTVGAVALGLVGYWSIDHTTTEAAVIRVVFIGLSALTVPHIVFCMLASSLRTGISRA